MTPLLVVAGGVAAAAMTFPLLLGGAVATGAAGRSAAMMGAQPAAAPAVLGCEAPSGVTVGDLDTEQLRHAATITAVGRRLGVPDRGVVVALATAMQESTLRNLDYGDRDSLGLFQQRAGWGSVVDRTHPATSAGMFYAGGRGGQPGLLDVEGWQSMPVTEAAQAVQRSAFPDAYARHEALAVALVEALTGDRVAAGCDTTPAAGWVRPVAAPVTSPFGMRVHPITGARRMHTGTDFGAPTGTPVRSVGAGRVLAAGWGGGYGWLVKVAHGGGVESWYAHLSRTSVAPGQSVPAGGRLGAVGSTGNSTGPHLHLEVRVDGGPTDPLAWLRGRGVAW